MPHTPQPFLDHQPELEAALGERVSISGLVGAWSIFQRLEGHRHSIDDATTAWYALRARPAAASYLDLGTGIGTVGLITLHGLHESTKMTCVEAQALSYQLLRANVHCNGLENRVTMIHGDLRDLELGQRFELITGSPPYFPAHAGTLPKDSQKAYARFELRGHVGDYAAAAKRHLAEGGVFVYCFPYQQKQRGVDLVRAQGFHHVSCRDIQPTRNSPPLFSVFSAVLSEGEPMIQEPPLIVQGDDGKYTEQMLEIQASRGFGPQGSN